MLWLMHQRVASTNPVLTLQQENLASREANSNAQLRPLELLHGQSCDICLWELWSEALDGLEAYRRAGPQPSKYIPNLEACRRQGAGIVSAESHKDLLPLWLPLTGVSARLSPAVNEQSG